MITIYLPTTTQAQTVRFYLSHFGFRRRAALGPVVFVEHPSGVSLGIEEVQLAEAFPPTFRLQIRLQSWKEAKSVLDSLLADDVEVADSPGLPSESGFFAVRDPDGRRVVVLWPSWTHAALDPN